MILKIDTNDIHDPDILGELLRQLSFTNEGYGCYENFNLRKEFTPQDNEVAAKLIDDGYGETDEDILEYAKSFTNGIWNVAWYWDGDGTLVFWNEDFAVINEDCKKEYGWKLLTNQFLSGRI